ncbi:hypothetical protein K32_32540 [Kaistia sp. 32K]|nr:hypothetical protein K32_32540 [Kaistia sp. 32K]
MTNSVVPMPNEAMARAKSAIGMKGSGRREAGKRGGRRARSEAGKLSDHGGWIAHFAMHNPSALAFCDAALPVCPALDPR